MGKSVEEILSYTDSSVHSIMNQTKARFDAILRNAVKKSDAMKDQNSRRTSKKNSRNSLVTTMIFTSQQNLMSSDYDSDKIINETNIRKSPRRGRRKRSEVRELPDTSDYSLSEAKPNSNPSETEEAEYDRKCVAEKSRGKLFRDDNVSIESQPLEDQEKPVPKPRLTKSAGYFQVPVPKSRSIYSQVQDHGQQTHKDFRERDWSSDMTSIDTTPRLSSGFHSPNLTYSKNNVENVNESGDVEYSKDAVVKIGDVRHKNRSRDSNTEDSKQTGEVFEMKQFKKRKLRKPKKTVLETRLEVGDEQDEPEEVADSNVIGVYIHEMTWIGNQKNLLRSMLSPFVTVYVVFENNLSKPKADPLSTTSWRSSSQSFRPPKWEELLIFQHDFNELQSPKVVLMFEIMDVKNITKNNDVKQHCIAWAFLKPIGNNGASNTHTKVRLQLFKPDHSQARGDGNGHAAYEWWKSSKRDKFPGTLFVTINSLRQKECLSKSIDVSEKLTGYMDTATQPERLWTRLPGQMCKLPNKNLSTICQSSKGCLVVKFSRNGRLLACATTKDNSFSIYIYKIPEITEIAVLFGHQGLVYDLCWSYDDALLLSASADRTVSVWDMRKMKSSTQLLQFLPHPSFVYGVTITEDNLLVASSCYDKIVRLWSRERCNEEFNLTQELEGHTEYVTATCFGKNCLFSGDSDGILIEWVPTESFWIRNRILCSSELHNSIISRISLHPSRRRLLVHSRNNILRIVDIQTGVATQWLKSSINNKMQISSCFTPCGSMVFAGGENGQISVWDSATGIRRAIYIPPTLPPGDAITAIDYHPLDHIMAISSYGSRSKVLICHYKQNVGKSNDVGLHLLHVGEVLNSNRTIPQKEEISSEKLMKINNNLSNTTIEDFNPGNNRKPIKLANLIEKIDGILKPAIDSSSNLQPIEKPMNDKVNSNENRIKIIKVNKNKEKKMKKYNASTSSPTMQTYVVKENIKSYRSCSSVVTYDSDESYSVVNFKLNIPNVMSTDVSERSYKKPAFIQDNTYSISVLKNVDQDESSSNVESLPTDSLSFPIQSNKRKAARNLKVKVDVHEKASN